VIERKANQIEEQINELSCYAEEHELDGLCVVCEPTGGYDRELLRLARKQGHRTAYVNTEHSSKMSSVEPGDTNKTDPADAGAMSLVAQVDRTQAHRTLEGEYGLLRQLGQMYEDEDEQAVQVRTRFQHVLKKLFCDYDKSSRFLFDSTGEAVMEEYAWDPQAIVQDGYERFCERIKSHVHVKRARWSTLEALFKQARWSAKMQWPERCRSVWKRRLKQLWDDYKRHSRRKEEIAGRIEKLCLRLQERGELPAPFEETTAKQLGRLVGELGPLGDFEVHAAVEKYVGLNLRERESGDYEGKITISKARPDCRRGRVARWPGGSSDRWHTN
jgi:transposase